MAITTASQSQLGQDTAKNSQIVTTSVKLVNSGASTGPSISSIIVTDSGYNSIDDTAAATSNSYIRILGTGFTSTANVFLNGTMVPKANVTFVNSSELRAALPVSNTGNYAISVYNSNSAGALYSSSFVISTMPQWLTSSTLANVTSNQAFSTTLSATSDSNITYSNTTALPAGTTLASNGYFYGTISVADNTSYSFDVKATDAENQDTTRTFNLLAVSSDLLVDYLVVAGGGGGGGPNGGAGGGAGGYRAGSLTITRGTTYTVTVGAGGSKGSGVAGLGSRGSSGGDSVFSSITSAGGGAGGTADNQSQSAGLSGGSGGGGASYGTTTVSGGSGNTPSTSPSQGNNGGSGGSDNDTWRSGGGGGGASAVGTNGSSSSAGNGGNGTSSSISGSAVTYAGGGGGGAYNNISGGTGGTGGGGNGQINVTGEGGNGTTNTGGGGGGAGRGTTSAGNGGSGIVIIRYPDTFPAATSATNVTVNVSGGYRIYTWTGSGTFTY
jgi:hypothetical protein